MPNLSIIRLLQSIVIRGQGVNHFMRRYCKLSAIPLNNLKEIFEHLFTVCNKVNIYFPNITSPEISEYKITFLKAAHIDTVSEEALSTEDALEEKEGYSMVIASLSNEVKDLIYNMNTDFHLSLGLIAESKVLFYIGDEDECIIEDASDSTIFSSPLFDMFKPI
ncbi:MAG: hypothetical protein K0R69_1192 [Clostridia bacterium]|nr:hypothetical protein [Clostridia bacterium]